MAARSGAFSAIVAVDADDAVVGFASLSPYKERAAYRTTVEDSVYVDRERNGQGIGQLLLGHVVDVARASGFHAVMARIERRRRPAAPCTPLRLRAGGDRARGRAQVRPLARRGPHASPPLHGLHTPIAWLGGSSDGNTCMPAPGTARSVVAATTVAAVVAIVTAATVAAVVTAVVTAVVATMARAAVVLHRGRRDIVVTAPGTAVVLHRRWM